MEQHETSTGEIRPAARDSVSALLQHIIDYAGLFPPARLDMRETVRNYASYLESPAEWMLQRLIVPASRLDEFENEAATLLPTDEEAEPWPIAALTAPAGDEKLTKDLARIDAFNAHHEDYANGLAVVGVIELKGDTAAAIDAALDQIPEDLFPFFEIPSDTDPRGCIAALVGGEAGAKIRTGGVTEDLYPSAQQVARFINACAGANVPFKATAGLHHPLRHFSETLGIHELGFLNVFLAGALAATHELSEEGLVAVLEEEQINAFRFDDEEISWRDHRLNLDEVDFARLECAISFGSCSFDEPIQDLRVLGLL